MCGEQNSKITPTLRKLPARLVFRACATLRDELGEFGDVTWCSMQIIQIGLTRSQEPVKTELSLAGHRGESEAKPEKRWMNCCCLEDIGDHTARNVGGLLEPGEA